MRIKNLSFLLLAGCFALASCNKYVVETDKRIETTLARVEEYRDISKIPDLPENIDTVRVQNDIWLGNNSTKIMEGEALPSWVEKEDGITMSISEEASLTDILQEISDMTGITIRLDDLRIENAIPEEKVAIKYSGKLSGLLNYLANRYSVYWRYKNDTITFFTQETRVFTVYALPTETTLSASMSGATMGEGGGGNASSNLSLSSDLKIWDSIEEGVKQVVGDNGKLSFSRVAGTITVTASPYVVHKVADYVNSWNEKLSRQVAITAQLLVVTLNNEDTYGLNLNAAFGGDKIVSTFGTGAGLTGQNLAMTLLKPGKWSGTNAVIQALSTQGKTRLVTSASVTTLNNKVAPVQVSTSENYVKEITVTTSGSGDDKTVDTDMEVDTLNYGITMEVLPRILDHGRLILLFNLSYTELLDLKSASSGSTGGDSGGSSGSDDDDDGDDESETKTVQLPKMQMRGFVQEIAMRSGQTLVLSGFEKTQERTETSGIGKAKMGLLGGLAKNTTTREVLVVLLTPEILQSPLSPEALMRDN